MEIITKYLNEKGSGLAILLTVIILALGGSHKLSEQRYKEMATTLQGHIKASTASSHSLELRVQLSLIHI